MVLQLARNTEPLPNLSPKAPNDRLKRERELRGWSQARLAEKLGTDSKRIGVWEGGNTVPDRYYQEKLCELFGKNAHELGFLPAGADLLEAPISTTPNNRLRYEREIRGWSQSRVAEALGTNPDRISRWERGFCDISPYYREKLCELFGKNAVELGLLQEIAAPGGAFPALTTDAHAIQVVEGCLLISTPEEAIRFSLQETKTVLRLLLIEHLTI
jgi:transcriptional regulator with XRE-family HTH domain